jgi:predicted GNAT family N-acyltransferase
MGKVTPLRTHGLSAPVRLDAGHDVSRFDCGNPELNDWLRTRARTSEGKHARTYVACDGNAVGYYCIASGSVDRKALPSKMKREQGQPNRTPVAIIGRLARDLRYRGTGLGADLLGDALTRIISASEIIGVRSILVHAIDDKVVAFYKSFEFIEFPDGSRTLFLPIESAIDGIS